MRTLGLISHALAAGGVALVFVYAVPALWRTPPAFPMRWCAAIVGVVLVKQFTEYLIAVLDCAIAELEVRISWKLEKDGKQ